MFTRERMHILFAAATVVAVLGHGTASAQAPGDQRMQALRSVAAACASDTMRFCPAVDPQSSTPRDQVMCLKFFRADLSLGCRNAVSAATADAH